jgi:hypothetical protein
MFNLRYGVIIVPGLAVFAALGIWRAAGATAGGRGRRRALGALAAALIIVQAGAWWPAWRDIPVVEEGLAQARAGAPQRRGAEWLESNARTGTVLIDDSVNPLLPVIDADLDRAIAPFSGRRWNRALRDPSRARWIFVDDGNPQDAVRNAIRRDPSVLDDLRLRFEDGPVRIYESPGTRP